MRIDALTAEATVLAELGRRLARLRKQRGMSQDQLAEQAGIGIATLRRLEGGHDGQLGTWIKLMKALGRAGAIDALLPESYRSPMAEVLGSGRRAAVETRDGGVRWGDEDR
jgi:transcriptional regulator with XRE-family HTH domain